MSKKELRKQGIETLLGNFDDEEMDDENEQPCTPKRFITFVRGSERKGTPSFEWNNLPDSIFFNTDIGREIILADQEAHEREFTLQNENPDCSSWTGNVPTISITKHMKERSEPISILSDANHFCGMILEPSFRCDASTPVTKGNKLFPLNKDMTTEDSSDLFSTVKYESIVNETPSLPSTLCLVTPKTGQSFLGKFYEDSSDLFSTLKNESIVQGTSSLASTSLVTPKTEQSFAEKFYVGSTNLRNIQRLRSEERKKLNTENTDTSFHSLEINKRSTSKSSFANEKPANISFGMWTVEPQEVVLDSTKGSRVILMNNSDHVLRFKSKFDGKIVNVCPLSGNVPAKSNIGLRIVISLHTKLSNVDTETDIKIIIGKSEKIIHVKILKEEKANKLKTRTYMLH